MTLETRLRDAAQAVQPPLRAVPPFDIVRRRRRRRRRAGALVAVAAAAAGIGVVLSSLDGEDATRVVAGPSATPSSAPASQMGALGLAVELPPGWAIQDGTCPAPLTVTVIDEVKRLPVPAGCAAVEEGWVAIQRIPEDLDGIDEACGPGFTDGIPFCQAIELDPAAQGVLPATERQFYVGLDVLVSIHYSAAAGFPNPGVGLSYADPAMVETLRPETYRFPETSEVAREAVERLLREGCRGLIADGTDTQSVIEQCEALAVPADGTLETVQPASTGGAVPAEYVVASVSTADGPVRYRLLIQKRWDPQARTVAAHVAAITAYDGPWPNPPCTTPPGDPRFLSTEAPGVCPAET